MKIYGKILGSLPRQTGFSSKRLFIEKPFHRIPKGVAFHRNYIRGGHSSKILTRKICIFDRLVISEGKVEATLQVAPNKASLFEE
jgi:hypothetical protein